MTAGVVICMPVDMTELQKRMPPGFPAPDPIPGSTQGTCQDCGQAVWIGPAQGALVAEWIDGDDALILCMLCGVRFASIQANLTGEVPTVRNLTNKRSTWRDADGNPVSEPRWGDI